MSAELGALSPEDTELWIPPCPALSPGLVETVPPGVERPASHVPLCTVATQMLASSPGYPGEGAPGPLCQGAFLHIPWVTRGAVILDHTLNRVTFLS